MNYSKDYKPVQMKRDYKKLREDLANIDWDTYFKELAIKKTIESKRNQKIKEFLLNYPDNQWNDLVKRFVEKQEMLKDHWFNLRVHKHSRLLQALNNIFQEIGEELSWDGQYGDFWAYGYYFRGYSIHVSYGQGTSMEIREGKTGEILFIS